MDKGDVMGVGWIKWAGAHTCPVDVNVRVMVRCADGHDRGPFKAGCVDWSWTRGGYRNDVCEYKVVEQNTKSVISDGGSSDYYKLTIKNKAGETLSCELGDIIRAVVGNDFDLGNILKATRRMHLAAQGVGKDGTTVTYDANKIKYFADEFAFWHEVL